MCAFVGACSKTPNLLGAHTLREGKTYAYRVPIAGCALPIVKLNGRNWEPGTPWPSTYPKAWKVTTGGPSMHKETYLVGTVRLQGEQLVIGLPDGTVVNRYHPTTNPQGLCA
jgi:hypothetical protein